MYCLDEFEERATVLKSTLESLEHDIKYTDNYLESLKDDMKGAVGKERESLQEEYNDTLFVKKAELQKFKDAKLKLLDIRVEQQV